MVCMEAASSTQWELFDGDSPLNWVHAALSDQTANNSRSTADGSGIPCLGR